MSLVSLAKTTFSTGPDDSALVLDIYKKQDSAPVNSIQDSTNESPFSTDLESKLKGQANLKSILKDIQKSDLLKKLDSTGAISRICGGSSSLKSLCQDLSSVAKGGFSIENGLKSLVTFELQGQISKIVSSQLGDAKALSGLVNNFTNNNFSGTFKDYGAITGFVTSITKQASAIGLSGVFKALSGSISDKNILVSSAGDLLRQAVSKGDSGLFLEIASSAIGKQVKNIFPSIVSSMISNVKLPLGLKQQEFSNFFVDLSKGFSTVDSSWDKYARGAVTGLVSNISINGHKVGSSPIFRQLLKSNVFSKVTAPTVASAVGQVGFVGPTDPSTMDEPTLKAYNDNNNKFLLLMDKYKVKTVGDDLKQMLPSIMVTPDPVYQNASSVFA